MFRTNTISRRQVLAGAGTAAMASALPGISAAQSKHPHQPLRAIHRFNIGRMKVTVIDDARFTFPAPAFAVNQPDGAIEKFLTGYGLPADTVSLHMQVTLVEYGPHKVLLDTGMGDVTFPQNTPDNGRLLAGLNAIGVSPDDITTVIISHGHPDHIGSCSINGEPAFRNASYRIASSELEFWTQKPGNEQSFPNFMLAVGVSQLEPVRDLIKPYKDKDEIVDGITAIAAPGHTMGHHAMLLHDGDNKLLHLMDTAVHYLVGPEQPDWALGVEMDHSAAETSRRRLFKQAAEQQLLVAGYHFPFPGIGRIVEQENAWRFVPMQTA